MVGGMMAVWLLGMPRQWPHHLAPLMRQLVSPVATVVAMSPLIAVKMTMQAIGGSPGRPLLATPAAVCILPPSALMPFLRRADRGPRPSLASFQEIELLKLRVVNAAPMRGLRMRQRMRSQGLVMGLVSSRGRVPSPPSCSTAVHHAATGTPSPVRNATGPLRADSPARPSSSSSSSSAPPKSPADVPHQKSVRGSTPLCLAPQGPIIIGFGGHWGGLGWKWWREGRFLLLVSIE